MCGRLVNLDTVARVLAEYYHLKTDTQLAALNDALSRVPAETVGKELFGISEQLNDTISRQQAIATAVSAAIDWHRLANPQYSIAYSIGEAMRALPSAQQERKKGKWIERNPRNSPDCRLIECSECGNAYIVGYNINYDDWIDRRNFCMKCGADLRGWSNGKST